MRFRLNSVTLDHDVLDAVTSAPQVRAQINAEGAAVLARAQAGASAAGATAFGRSLRLTTGVRPGTRSRGGFRRPFATVSATSRDAAAVEFGDNAAGVDKQSILRRAAGS